MEKLLEQKSLMISSLNHQLLPEISYAPFIRDGIDLYIYISKAAAHYHHLLMNPNCSVMLIEDEKDAKTKFVYYFARSFGAGESEGSTCGTDSFRRF